MDTDQGKIEQAADMLLKAQNSKTPCAPISSLLSEGDIDAAYAVQNINTDKAIAEGRRLIGRKIGLTSKAVQTQLGVDQPDYGMLFADMALADGEEVGAGTLIQPKVEAEIAFVLSKDLEHADVTLPELISAVEYALPAIEIVDSRIENWNINILDTIADNASSGLYILGGSPKKLEGLDLRLCGMVMEHNGDQVSSGAGVACLGHPLNAALWLARVMAQKGRPLKAGDQIVSGALGPMVAVDAGGVYEAKIEGLGSVRAAFA